MEVYIEWLRTQPLALDQGAVCKPDTCKLQKCGQICSLLTLSVLTSKVGILACLAYSED